LELLVPLKWDGALQEGVIHDEEDDMSSFYALKPEVAGGLGPTTIIANLPQLESGEATVPEVTQLEYRFDGWLGDELLASTPCFIVTSNLAASIQEAGLTGTRFERVKITTSEAWEQFRQMSPLYSGELPPFERLIPLGTVGFLTDGKIVNWSGHDFCVGTRLDYQKPTDFTLIGRVPGPHALVVTERAWSVLERHRLDNCGVEELFIP